MPWFLLLVAGLFEVFWAYMMKQSDGFTRLVPSALSIGGMVASVVLLGLAMKALPLGTSYMVWTGIGAVGTFLVGIVLLGETASLPRIAAATLIIAGVVLLKITSPE